MGLHSTSAARLALVAAGLLILTGCPSAEVPSPLQGTTESNGANEPEATVTPRPGMIDVEPVRIWNEYGGLEDGYGVYLIFQSQGPPCQVLDSVEVDEADTTVTITLYHGRDPDADPDEVCDGPDRVYRVDVPLSRDYPPDDSPIINGGSLTDGP